MPCGWNKIYRQRSLGWLGWWGYPVGEETATAVKTNLLLSSLQNKPVSSAKKWKMPSRDIKEKISGNKNQLSAQMTTWVCNNTSLRSLPRLVSCSVLVPSVRIKTFFLMTVSFKVGSRMRQKTHIMKHNFKGSSKWNILIFYGYIPTDSFPDTPTGPWLSAKHTSNTVWSG